MKLNNKMHHYGVIVFIIFIAECLVQDIAYSLYTKIVPDGKVMPSLSMLFVIVTYYIIGGILLLVKRPRLSMWVAIFAFMFVCIFLFYSESVQDVLTFVVAIVSILNSMIILNTLIKEQEESANHE